MSYTYWRRLSDALGFALETCRRTYESHRARQVVASSQQPPR
jgi:hypothetical protein